MKPTELCFAKVPSWDGDGRLLEFYIVIPRGPWVEHGHVEEDEWTCPELNFYFTKVYNNDNVWMLRGSSNTVSTPKAFKILGIVHDADLQYDMDVYEENWINPRNRPSTPVVVRHPRSGFMDFLMGDPG